MSVVVPTYRRGPALRTCLLALNLLDYPSERLELVVVSDGPDPAAERVFAAAELRFHASFITVEHGGPGYARNIGAGRASGALLAFTGDDCRPEPAWLERLVCATGPRRGAGGTVVNGLPGNPFCTATQLISDYLIERTRPGANSGGFFTPNNLVVPRAAFLSMGGFDDSFIQGSGEDRDFCARWLEHGLELAQVPDARVIHEHPLTLGRFWALHMNYGRGSYRFRARLAERQGRHVRLESAAFYAGLCVAPLPRARFPASVALSGLIVTAQVANALGFCGQALRAQRALPRVADPRSRVQD